MRVHLIEGAEGCLYAVQHQNVAVVVDALRASATAAMLLHAGATELFVVREIEDAFTAKQQFPDALLFGERGGLPPDGFDGGNSPQTVEAARGHRVIFTTTTGAQRLIAAWGAAAVYLASTVNASRAAAVAASHNTDIVLIPAGLATDPDFNAQEDWTAAVAIATTLALPIASGLQEFNCWRDRIEAKGVAALFASAPHAEKLRNVGLASDIAYCAGLDRTNRVPVAVARDPLGVFVKDARRCT